MALMLSVIGVPLFGLYFFTHGEITGSAVLVTSLAAVALILVAFQSGRRYGAEDLHDEYDLEEEEIYTVVYQDVDDRITVLKPSHGPLKCFKFERSGITTFGVGNQFRVGERASDGLHIYSVGQPRTSGMIHR